MTPYRDPKTGRYPTYTRRERVENFIDAAIALAMVLGALLLFAMAMSVK